jgi:hypothetical protein
MLVTEEEFELPLGYLEPDGTLHRSGVMRLATAADEILPMKDPRVRNLPAYLVVILLSRVVLRIGTVRDVTPLVIEGLFSQDLAFLQDLYNRMNGLAPPPVHTRCGACGAEVVVEVPLPGGSPATPSTGSTRR